MAYKGRAIDGNAQFQVLLWVHDRVPHLRVESNYKFMLPERKFELDVAIPAVMIGIEVDGLLPGARGRASTPPEPTFEDRVKDLEAACRGWRVFRVATDQVEDGTAFDYLERIFRRYL